MKENGCDRTKLFRIMHSHCCQTIDKILIPYDWTEKKSKTHTQRLTKEVFFNHLSENV